MIPVIVIEGATASGKSHLALELARLFQTEIISADSRQVYRGMDIGTAKPSPAEQLLVRHHLIDVITPDQTFNAGLFVKQALPLCHSIGATRKIPLVAGGTGMYIKALLEGLFVEPPILPEVRSELQQQLQTEGLARLFAQLQKVDPVLAERNSPNDKQRILRALVVYYSTGIPLSVHWKNQLSQTALLPFRILTGVERNELYRRIDARLIHMLNSGLLDEIWGLLQQGYDWTCPGFNSVGYKEFRAYFDQTAKLTECLSLAQQHSRNYAKRQLTWYRKITFHLTLPPKGINIKNVEAAIERYFEEALHRGN